MSDNKEKLKKLDRNHWRVKILKWAWGTDVYQFPGYCPIWWASNFTLLCAPILLISKMTLDIFSFAKSKLPEKKQNPNKFLDDLIAKAQSLELENDLEKTEKPTDSKKKYLIDLWKKRINDNKNIIKLMAWTMVALIALS